MSVSRYAQHQDLGAGKATWDAAIIGVIKSTCCSPTITCQIQKGLIGIV